MISRDIQYKVFQQNVKNAEANKMTLSFDL